MFAVVPIIGVRHRSTSQAKYDLCAVCVEQADAVEHRPYEQLRGPVERGQGGGRGGRGEREGSPE